MNENDKKRIAIVSSGYFPVPASHGGAVESIIENLLETNENEQKVSFIVFSCYDEAAKRIAGKYTNSSICFISIPLHIRVLDKISFWFFKNVLRKKKVSSYRYIFQRLFFIRHVGIELDHHDFDYVVFENHPTLLKALHYKKNFTKYQNKYAYHIHNEIVKDFGCKHELLACPVFLGVSDFINDSVSKTWHIPQDRFYSVKNRVDEKRFSQKITNGEKERIKEQYGIPSHNKVLLFCGRLSQQKGIMELIEAFKCANQADLDLLIVGASFFKSGVLTDFEKKLAGSCKGYETKIHFTGFIDYSMVHVFYALADFVVLPSIWNDPAPLAVIETIAARKCLVTTYSGGISEYVNADNAILISVSENIVSDLANTISELNQNPELIKKYEKEISKLSDSMNLKNYYFDFLTKLERGFHK